LDDGEKGTGDKQKRNDYSGMCKAAPKQVLDPVITTASNAIVWSLAIAAG